MSATARPHVLIVDDEPSVCEALSQALTRTYTVHAVGTGAAALACLSIHPIATIILDAVLQDEDGLDLVEKFRALSKAPILILTGYGCEELVVRALRARVDDYLKKPVKLAELQAALDRLTAHEGVSWDAAARARSRLDQHLDKGFKASELAAQLGMSEAHLRRLFRVVYGRTPRQYLLEMRMRRAGELLRTTELRLKQIAREVGYTNLGTFERNFKRVHKLLPSAFRLSTHRMSKNE